MPLLLSKRINDHSAYVIWKISETNHQLSEIIEEEIPKNFHLNKLAEWMASRILVKTLCEYFDIKYEGVIKNECGKPFLKNSKAQISISHSFPVASAMINLKSPCGIDVEWPRDKMQRIQHKFLHKLESEYENDNEALCIIWAAKEAVYKHYGKRKLSFKEQISLKIQEDNIEGTVALADGIEKVPMTLEKINDYFLVYTNS